MNIHTQDLRYRVVALMLIFFVTSLIKAVASPSLIEPPI